MREETEMMEQLAERVVVGQPPPRPRRKRLVPELRRVRVNFTAEERWHRRLLLRLKNDSQFLRSSVQAAFALLCLWIGVEFYLFTRWGFSAGSEGSMGRPPGVEGFLPISGLIGLRHWLLTSEVNTVHPAALFILLAILAVSLAMKKAFCSWLCPVGTLSESLWMLGQKLFGRTFHLPRWLDYPLRALKYLLLLFFVWIIFGMDASSLSAFVESPYNRMADVKMFLFFARISSFALGVITIFMILSMVVKNFWCRFLCPYGALLGIIGWLSPLKITRVASSCIDCGLCTKACPSDIAVHTAGRVWSDECNSCLRCVEECPVKDTLMLKTRSMQRAFPTWVYGILVAGTFAAVTGMAILTNHWRNNISETEYLHRFQEIDSPLYHH